jgi:hypothetical protein
MEDLAGRGVGGGFGCSQVVGWEDRGGRGRGR